MLQIMLDFCYYARNYASKNFPGPPVKREKPNFYNKLLVTQYEHLIQRISSKILGKSIHVT